MPIIKFKDVNKKYADYWNQIKMSRDICTNYMTPPYTQILTPLDTLNQVHYT